MAAKVCRITTFSKRTGESGVVTLPVNKVRAMRLALEKESIIITSSRLVSG